MNTKLKYNEKDGDYVFDGDLAKFLIERNVPIGHVNRMKCKVLQKSREKGLVLHERTRELELVPLDKVIGMYRAEDNLSVFDNVNNPKDGKLKAGKLIGCLKYLDMNSIDDLYRSYQELDEPVEMDYYVDEDLYFVTNGNHRTITAMITGAPYIKAKVCRLYKK